MFVGVGMVLMSRLQLGSRWMLPTVIVKTRCLDMLQSPLSRASWQ